jgi:hypothetical protein
MGQSPGRTAVTPGQDDTAADLGLRLHLACTLGGLPVAAALTGAKADERQVLLDLERHGGRTGIGVAVRVLQRILALTAAVGHNDKTGQPILRSLVAYDH